MQSKIPVFPWNKQPERNEKFRLTGTVKSISDFVAARPVDSTASTAVTRGYLVFSWMCIVKGGVVGTSAEITFKLSVE
jgi:hypothetical protein